MIAFDWLSISAILDDEEKAKSVDLDELEAEIEEEANMLARQKYKVSMRGRERVWRRDARLGQQKARAVNSCD